MLSKLLVVLALMLALLGAADAKICKSSSAPVGRCNVKVKVCGKIRKLKWRYTGDATEPSTGFTGHSSNHKSGKGAAEGAVKDMFAKHPELQAHCFGTEFGAAFEDVELEKLVWADEE